MNRHSFFAFFALALLFILSAVTVSAQQTRAVPPNDNFGSAKAIKIGKDYRVKDIGAATNEGGEPGTICASGNSVPNSVWFSFTLPEFSRIYFSTAGTVLVEPTDHNYYTVFAIYELTGGVLTERACSSYQNETPFAQLEFAANAGITYYIAAGTRYNIAYLPESTLKLNTRILWTTTAMTNSDFEIPISAANWTLKNGGDDGIVCGNLSFPALNGSCTFRFTGTPDVTTKLTQTMPYEVAFLPRKNALLGTVFFYRIMNTAALGKTKVKIVIAYSDGTPPAIFTANLTGGAAMGDYLGRIFWTSLKSSKVASVKFDVKFASPSGTLLLDLVNVIYQTDAATRTDGLLPLPPPAQ